MKFSKTTMRRVKNWEKKGPSQGIIPKCEPQERNPWAPKFEERTQDETLKRERCALKDAWELAKDVYKLKMESKDTFHSLVEAWIMPAPSSTEPEERHFVIDSGASMHMSSEKNLSSGELETQEIWIPITVVIANGDAPDE